MRKFIATCCCLIVGLQVLIGVPLVICVVFFAYASAAGGPVVVTHSAAPPIYAAGPTFPAPQPPWPVDGPPALAPAPYGSDRSPAPQTQPPSIQLPQSSPPEPAKAYSPSAQPLPVPFASPAPTLSLSPARVIEPASAGIEDKPLEPAAVAEIVATREQVGSPLEGTLLEDGKHETAFLNALADAELHEPAEPATDAPSEPCQPTQYVITAADGSMTTIFSTVPPTTETLAETLALAIKQLYAHADWHEQACPNWDEPAGSWARADEIRKLARALARERALVESLRPQPRQAPYPDEAAAAYAEPVEEAAPEADTDIE